MGTLRNPQHEIYARELVEIELSCVDSTIAGQRGQLRHQAYKKAGYDGNADNARRLAHHPQVRRRFRELFNEAMEYRDVRIGRVVARIDRVGRANILDFFELGPNDKLKLKDLTKLPREMTDAIRSIKHRDDGAIELEFWDKNQANFTLLKHLGGMPQESANATANLNFLSVLSVDDQRTLVEALKSVAARGEPADSGIREEHSPV